MPYMDGLELKKTEPGLSNIYIMLAPVLTNLNMRKRPPSGDQGIYAETHQRHRTVRSLMKLKTTLDRNGKKKLNVKTGRLFPGGITKLQSNFFISLIEEGQRRGL